MVFSFFPFILSVTNIQFEMFAWNIMTSFMKKGGWLGTKIEYIFRMEILSCNVHVDWLILPGEWNLCIKVEKQTMCHKKWLLFVLVIGMARFAHSYSEFCCKIAPS